MRFFAVLVLVLVGCGGGPVLDPRPRPANARALCARVAEGDIAWMAMSTARFVVMRDEHDEVIFEPAPPAGNAERAEHVVLTTEDGRQLILVEASLLEYEVRERLGANAALRTTIA